jgi:ELWxxDGT repeat protein
MFSRDARLRSCCHVELLESRLLLSSTPSPAELVKDINIVGPGSNPRLFAELDGTAYFIADESRSLWRTDGRPEGTELVRRGHSGSGDVTELTTAAGRLWFGHWGDGIGKELWTSDGTPEGTYIVKDIFPGASSSDPRDFIEFEGIVYFTATNNQGRELWRTDGTEAGTWMVKDIWVNSPFGAPGPRDLVVFNDLLYFVANDGIHGDELWRTDRTEAGTVMVSDAVPGGSGLFSNNLRPYFVELDGILLFRAWSG